MKDKTWIVSTSCASKRGGIIMFDLFEVEAETMGAAKELAYDDACRRYHSSEWDIRLGNAICKDCE